MLCRVTFVWQWQDCDEFFWQDVSSVERWHWQVLLRVPRPHRWSGEFSGLTVAVPKPWGS